MLLVAGVMVFTTGDGSVEQQPADTPPNTLPDANPTMANLTSEHAGLDC